MYDRFFNDRSFAKDAKMESCYQRQQKGKKYLPTKIYRPSSIIFNNFSLPHCIKILLTIWDFSYLFHNVFDKKSRLFHLQSKSIVPPLFLLRYSIDTPSIVHRFDGDAMDKRWRCDGDVMEKQRRKSGIRVEAKRFQTLSSPKF